MQEVLALVFNYVWGAWRHRWLALIVAWVLAIGGWVWVWQLPEAYVAKARVFVDTNSVLRPLLRGLAIQPDINQRITLMSRTLLSRPNLEKLMRMTDLDLEVSTDKEKEKMLSDLTSSISLAGERRNASLYYISVKNEDRDTARRIAQALITVFIESSLGNTRSDSSEAQSFLDQQIADYERRLIESERRLAQFKQENVSVLSGAGGGYYGNLEAARAALSAASLQLREMENRQRELQRQLAGEEPVFIPSGVSVSRSGSMSPLDARIQSLRVRMDDLLTRYTDQHPEVRQIGSLIEELEAERVGQYTQLREDPVRAAMSGLDTNTVYQGMRSMLAATEANVAELRVRVAEYQRRVVDLESKVDSIPNIEAELKQLDRDYSVVSGQHQQLLQRRESARLSEDVEQDASDVVFRVIDPPFVPSVPSEPNKILLNGVVLLGALGAGLGLALLLFLLSPVIGNPQTLINVSGLPLLGTVTLTRQPAERRAEIYGWLTYAVCCAGLLLIYVGLSVRQVNLFA